VVPEKASAARVEKPINEYIIADALVDGVGDAWPTYMQNQDFTRARRRSPRTKRITPGCDVLTGGFGKSYWTSPAIS